MKIFDFFLFKVLAGKPQRVRKNTALSLLAVACMFLRRSNFVTPLFARALFWFYTSTVYVAFLFRDMHFGDIVKLLESNVLICFLKITTADLRKIGLKIWE